MNARKSKSLAICVGVLALAVGLVALAISGCGSSTKALALTESDSGKSFTVKVGDTISVVLAGNPTTGYSWESDLTENTTALLTLMGEPAYKQDNAGAGLTGSGGKYTFTFSAAAVGQADLKLKYWRTFEPETDPVQTFSASINIE